MPALALVAPADPAPTLLDALIAQNGFMQRISECAVLAEEEALAESLESYRTGTHRGVRAQQQFIHHLGTFLCGELGFVWDEVDSQARFISPAEFGDLRIRIFSRRGRRVSGGFSISYRKGRTTDLLNENKAQMKLFDPAPAPSAESDVVNVVIVCEVVSVMVDGVLYPDAELRVHVGVPTDHINGVLKCDKRAQVHAALVGEAVNAATSGTVTEDEQNDEQDIDLEEIDEAAA